MSPYEVLEIDVNASPEEIKNAHRKLAKRWHPDRNPGDETAAQKFKEVQEAYDILTDKRPIPQQNNPFDMFDMFFNQNQRPNQYFAELDLDFLEAYLGCNKTVKVNKEVTCKNCDGFGASDDGFESCTICAGQGSIIYRQRNMTIKQTCGHCKGKGKTIIKPCIKCSGKGTENNIVELSIKIPEGTNHLDKFRLNDIILKVNVKDHPLFKKIRNELMITVPITFSEAFLGTKIKIPILKKDVEVDIPAGICSGTLIKSNGVILIIEVETPKKTDDLETLFYKIKDLESKTDKRKELESFLKSS